MKCKYTYSTNIGNIEIVEENNYIIGITFNTESEWEKKETKLIKNTYVQISEYLSGKRQIFDVPIQTKGTEFQNKVWAELRQIPYGETRTYKQIAENIGNPKACRAVGMANHNNPIAIIIPCHRVIGANHKLVGYAGGLEIKHELLKIESFSK